MNRRDFIKRAITLMAAVAAAPTIESFVAKLSDAQVAEYAALPDARLYTSISDGLAALKEIYSADMLNDLFYKDNPFLAMVKK